MKLIFQPQLSNIELRLLVRGDVLIINERDFDFSRLTDGAKLPRDAISCELISGDVSRIGGVLHIPLLLPISADAGDAARFPEPVFVVSDGPVELPK